MTIQDHETDYKIIPAELDFPLTLLWGSKVFESVGGGAILAKDFARGDGIERVNDTRLDYSPDFVARHTRPQPRRAGATEKQGGVV